MPKCAHGFALAPHKAHTKGAKRIGKEKPKASTVMVFWVSFNGVVTEMPFSIRKKKERDPATAQTPRHASG
jgi:hypothetical protein